MFKRAALWGCLALLLVANLAAVVGVVQMRRRPTGIALRWLITLGLREPEVVVILNGPSDSMRIIDDLPDLEKSR